MSDVETVALWLGLFAGIVSTVLAVVAIAFTFVVDRRSSAINEQMIKSLQKIESTVEGVAGDTADLIKVAWDRMLPGSPTPSGADDSSDDESVRAIAAGVAAELKAELAPEANEAGQAAIQHLDEAVQRLERTMRAQLRSGGSQSSSRSDRFEVLQARLQNVSVEARELARQLALSKHLTRDQYRKLLEGPLARPLRELRQDAILVPLQGRDPDGTEIPVYFFAPGNYRLVQPVISFLEPTPRDVRERVRGVLESTGYPVKEGDE